MNEFRFSPIETKIVLIEALKYVVDQTSQMANEIIVRTLPISSLTIFSHDPDDFIHLSNNIPQPILTAKKNIHQIDGCFLLCCRMIIL